MQGGTGRMPKRKRIARLDGRQNENACRGASVFWSVERLLRALDVRGARALRGILDFEGDGVTDLEVVVLRVDERRLVEEDVLVAAFRGDETETLVGHGLDRAVHV